LLNARQGVGALYRTEMRAIAQGKRCAKAMDDGSFTSKF